MAEKENKSRAFKDAAARQREKIKGLKHHDVEQQNLEAQAVEGPGEESIQALAERPQPLTAENLQKQDNSVKASSKAPSSKKAKKGAQKPAWAQTA